MAKQERKQKPPAEASRSTPGNSIGGFVDALARGSKIMRQGPWGILSVIVLALAAAFLWFAFTLPPADGARTILFVLGALLLVAFAVILVILFKRPPKVEPSAPPEPAPVKILPEDRQGPPLVIPPQPAPVFVPAGPIHEEWFRSEHSKQVAHEFNQHSGDGPASRFFAEMMIHRLKLHGATRHEHGYTITRHAEDLPERDPKGQRDKIIKVMREDYEAIFHAAKAAPTVSGTVPRFDTTIFRDLELWTDGTYWHPNRELATNTVMRRLFLYENDMFKPNEQGCMPEEHYLEIFGLFLGVLIHRKESWAYNVLNLDDLRHDGIRTDLLGDNWKSKVLQSSAAFDQHTVVFINLLDGPTLVHRFYNDPALSGNGRVQRFMLAFNEAFMMDKRPKAADDLMVALCQDHEGMRATIEKAFRQAQNLLKVYEANLSRR